MKVKKAKKKPLTYEEAHNKALRLYSKTALFLLWIGVLNVLSSLIGVIQVAKSGGNWPSSGYALATSFQIAINFALSHLNIPVWDSLLIFFISVLFGALFAFLGLISTKGYKVPLIIGISLYFLDFIALFLIYFLYIDPMNMTNFFFSLILHIFLLGGLFVAVYNYIKIIRLEVKYKGNKEFNVETSYKVKEIAKAKEDKEEVKKNEDNKK